MQRRCLLCCFVPLVLLVSILGVCSNSFRSWSTSPITFRQSRPTNNKTRPYLQCQGRPPVPSSRMHGHRHCFDSHCTILPVPKFDIRMAFQWFSTKPLHSQALSASALGIVNGDHVALYTGAALWLTLLFKDLKETGIVRTS